MQVGPERCGRRSPPSRGGSFASPRNHVRVEPLVAAAVLPGEDDGVVARMGPTSGVMGKPIDVGSQPRFVTAAFDGVWVSSYFDGTVTRIDPRTDKAVAEVTTDQGPQIMAEAGGLLWVSCTDTDTVQAIDPETNEVVATVDTPIAPDGLAFDGTTLWVATELGPELAGIDPATHEIVAHVVVAEHGLINANQVMVFEEGSLWLPILDDRTVLRISPPAT